MTRLLSALELLDAWERALDEPLAVRPAVLAAAATGSAVDEARAWDLGRRDAALFDLRAQLFGNRAEAVSDCPACGARLDVGLDLTAIAPAPSPPDRLSAGPYRVSHRLPTTDDLLALEAEPDDDAARRLLVRRALVAVQDGSGAPVAFESLAADDQAMVAAAVALGHDGIDVRLALSCSECGHEWVAPFDIGSYLWGEVEAWAGGLLREVSALAAGYGWSERDILGLSARRRRAYLELLGAP